MNIIIIYYLKFIENKLSRKKKSQSVLSWLNYIKKNIMYMIVLASLDCLKGKLKMMLLSQYQNQRSIEAFL